MMKHRDFQQTLWLWLAVMASALSVIGCDSDAAGANASSHCRTDADCGSPALVCYDGRMCIARNTATTEVVVRLSPPKDSGKIVEHFAIELASSTQTEQVALLLTDPVVVRGTVRRDKQTWPDSIPGALVAMAADTTTGVPLTFQTTSYASKKMFVGSALPQGFELRVQPGLTYEVAFQPEANDQIPPHYSKMTVGASIDDWDKIVLPAPDKLVRLQGQLTAGPTTLTGLRVYTDDGEGHVTSTRGATDAKGQFELLIEPQATVKRLRFEPAQANSGLPQGHLKLEMDVAKAALKQEVVKLGTLDMGDLGPATEVTVTVVGPTGVPEGGAMVRLQQQVHVESAAMSAFVEVHGHTDAAGGFHAPLHEGKLTAWVVPMAASPTGGVTKQLVSDNKVLTIACPLRKVLQGRVVSQAGGPAAGAAVVARRVGVAPGKQPMGGQALATNEFTTKTDADGRFVLPVDPGQWWVWTIPEAHSQLPRLLAAQVEVAADNEPPPLAITLAAPLLLRGKAVAGNGSAIGGVAVDILASANMHPQQVHSGTGNRIATLPNSAWDSHLLASTVTAADGTFEVLVSPTTAP